MTLWPIANDDSSTENAGLIYYSDSDDEASGLLAEKGNIISFLMNIVEQLFVAKK